MSFVDHLAFGEAPKRVCPERFGGLLSVFPPGVLEGHERAGYNFVPTPCVEAIEYDPDYCISPGDVKKDPDTVPPAKEAILGMLQTAINCPTGITLDELRDAAKQGLEDNIERAIEAEFTAYLATLAVPSGAGATPICLLGNAAQYLAESGQCGRGIIVGPVGWFVQLTDALVWNQAKGYHHDYVGNIVIPHSDPANNTQVFALDAAVEIKISEVQLLDELAPGIRERNDRVVRAEQLFTVAVDACAVGSFTYTPC